METVTSTLPSAVPGGAVTTTWALDSLMMVAPTPLKSTAVALSRFVPVIVTVSPPACSPAGGLIAVTFGMPALASSQTVPAEPVPPNYAVPKTLPLLSISRLG